MTGKKASSRGLEADKFLSTNAPANDRPGCGRIGALGLEVQPQPIVIVPCVVHENVRRTAVLGEYNIQVAIIVEVPNCKAPRGIVLSEGGTGHTANVFDSSTLEVVQQQQRLAIMDSVLALVGSVIGMTMAKDQIRPAIVVIIDELDTPCA